MLGARRLEDRGNRGVESCGCDLFEHMCREGP